MSKIVRFLYIFCQKFHVFYLQKTTPVYLSLNPPFSSEPRPRHELILEFLGREGILAGPHREIDQGEPEEREETDDEGVRVPRVPEKLKVAELRPEDLLYVGVSGVFRERQAAELHHGRAAQQHQHDVEEEGAHVRLVPLHGMDAEPEEPQSHLKITVDRARQQVQCHGHDNDNPSEREGVIGRPQRSIQHGSQRRVGQYIQCRLQHPQEGEHRRDHPHHQLPHGHQRVVLVLFLVAVLEIGDVILQHVHRHFELVERRLVLGVVPPLGEPPPLLLVELPPLPFEAEDVPNLHEVGRAGAHAELRFRELQGVHVAGTVDVGGDVVDGEAREADPRKDREQDPSEERHDGGDEKDRREGQLHVRSVVRIRRVQPDPIGGRYLRRGDIGQPVQEGPPRHREGLEGVIVRDRHLGERQLDTVEVPLADEEDQRGDDYHAEGVPCGLARHVPIGPPPVLPRHVLPVVRLVVEHGERDDDQHERDGGQVQHRPEGKHVDSPAQVVVQVALRARGAALAVRHVQAQGRDGGLGEQQACEDHHLGSVRLVPVVGVLERDQHDAVQY
mmetsp:Transcript_42372/g.83237  ORF Transcript_42372/g.83237 Transcript_42372/m.83237 type:complete len:559 (-) Transcript_42372:216-1892(-)